MMPIKSKSKSKKSRKSKNKKNKKTGLSNKKPNSPIFSSLKQIPNKIENKNQDENKNEDAKNEIINPPIKNKKKEKGDQLTTPTGRKKCIYKQMPIKTREQLIQEAEPTYSEKRIARSVHYQYKLLEQPHYLPLEHNKPDLRGEPEERAERNELLGRIVDEIEKTAKQIMKPKFFEQFDLFYLTPIKEGNGITIKQDEIGAGLGGIRQCTVSNNLKRSMPALRIALKENEEFIKLTQELFEFDCENKWEDQFDDAVPFDGNLWDLV